MRWGLREHPEGPRISMLQSTTNRQLSKSRESISASAWNTGDETAKTLGGQWNTYAGPSPRLGWDSATRGRLNQTCPKLSGSQKTIIDTGLSKSSGNTGFSSVAAFNHTGPRGITPKAVSFNDSNVSSVQAVIHSPSGQTSNARGTSVEQREKRPCPSSGKASAERLPRHTSSPRLSDVGSDREADSGLDLSRLFSSLDPCRVSTPRKVGSLPFVPRLDKPDQAVPMDEDSGTAEEITSSPIRAVSPTSPTRAATPFPVPAPRPSLPSGSRRRHRSFAPGRLLDMESEEECHSLPAYAPDSSDDFSGIPRRGGLSRLTARSNVRQGLPRSSGDVSLTDVISRMKLLERAGSDAQRTISGVAKSVVVNASSEGSSSG